MGKVKKLLASGFIVLILLTMIRTHLSFDSAFVRTIFRPIDPALSFFSFYQDWMMFAPNPTRTNYEFYAQVEFISGERVDYKFESPGKLNHLEKYLGGEKMRKYLQDTVSQKFNEFTYKDLSKHVLRQIGPSHSDKIPLRVMLIKSTAEINFPEFKNSVSKNEEEVFYIHEVI